MNNLWEVFEMELGWETLKTYQVRGGGEGREPNMNSKETENHENNI